MAAGFVVGIFYALEALQSERRDRSILFWKSLPVSDVITVLSKASIPIIVLPLITFAVTVALWIIVFLVNSAVLLGIGVSRWWRVAEKAGAIAALILLYLIWGELLVALEDIHLAVAD